MNMEKFLFQEVTSTEEKYAPIINLEQASEILGLTVEDIKQLLQENLISTISPNISKIRVSDLVAFKYGITGILPIFQGSNASSALQSDNQDTENEIGKGWVFMAKLDHGDGSLYTSKGGTKFHVAFYYVNHENLKLRKVLTANSEEEVLSKMNLFKENLAMSKSRYFETDQKLEAVASGDVHAFKEVYGEYMEMWSAKDRSEATKKEKKYLYREFILPYFADMNITKITATDVQKFYNQVKIKKDGELRSVSGMKKIRTHLNTIFDFAMNAQGYISKLPTHKVDLPQGKETDKEARFFELEELLEIFADLIAHEKYFLVAKILMGTGLRSQEFLALQWSNIDFEEKTIKISNAMIQSKDEKGNNVQVLGATKTKASVRTIYVGSVVLDALKQWKAYQVKYGIDKKAKELGTEDFVVLDKNGNVHLYHSFHNNYMKHIHNKGTFKHHANWYSFRHCFASYNHSQGVDQMVIKRFMGHTGDNLTEKVYTSIPKEKLLEGAEIYNNFLEKLFEDVEKFIKVLGEEKDRKQQEIILLEQKAKEKEPELIETTEEITEEESNIEMIRQKVNLKKTVTKRTKCYKK